MSVYQIYSRNFDDSSYKAQDSENNPVADIPLEVLHVITSHLPIEDMELVANVEYLHESALVIAKRQILSAKKFAKIISAILRQTLYSSQSNALDEIKERPFQAFNTWDEAKRSMLQIKEQILNILKTLKTEDLLSLKKMLEKKEFSPLLQNLFPLALIYKEIGQVTPPIHSAESRKLEKISLELMKNGSYYKALEIADRIIIKDIQEEAIIKIAKELMNNNEFFLAMNLINNKLSNQSSKNKFFTGISIELAKRGLINRAIEILDEITNQHLMNVVLKKISVELAKRGRFKRAIEISDEITSKSHRNKVLRDISIELAKQGLFDKAIEILDEITNQLDIDNALKEIAIELSRRGFINRAIEILDKISNKFCVDTTLKTIMLMDSVPLTK